MADLIEARLHKLGNQLPDRLSRPGDDRYVTATAVWAKPSGSMPRAVIHCRTVQDVQSAIRAVRDCDLPLSVRGGGHDWAGRSLCDGIVIDLSGMNSVVIDPATHTARISGGARASDVVRAADPLGLALVTGSVGTVGMAGLTLGGGYGLRSCRRWYIAVTTPKFPPPPRNAQKSSFSLSSRASETRPSARTTSAASKLSRARPKRPISGP